MTLLTFQHSMLNILEFLTVMDRKCSAMKIIPINGMAKVIMAMNYQRELIIML
ncbi:hypothetical protein D3C86_2172890 [compost metagenome]